MTPPVRSRPRAAMAFILLTLLIDILGIGIVVPILPELVKQMVGGDTSEVVAELATPSVGADTLAIDQPPASEITYVRAGRYVGVITATYALMQFLCAPILGALSDRFGRRPVLLIAMFGLAIDYLIQGFAPTIGWLFVGRTLAGMMGASLTTANAYIADISNDDNRARNFGLVGAMFGLGFAVGPALGGWLGDINLRLPFFVSAGLALVNAIYGFFILPESLSPENRTARFSFAGLSPFAAIGHLRTYPLVAALAVVVVLRSLAQRGLENVWVLYTSFRFDWDTKANGLALGLVGVMAIVVQGGLVRPVIKRMGERAAVVMGTLVSAIAFAGYGLAPSESWMPWIIVFGAIGGFAGPAIQSLVTGSVSETEQGKVQGAMTSLMSLTSIASPLIFNTLLFSFFVSPSAPIVLPGAPLLAGSLLLLVAVLVAVVVLRRQQETAS